MLASGRRRRRRTSRTSSTWGRVLDRRQRCCVQIITWIHAHITMRQLGPPAIIVLTLGLHGLPHRALPAHVEADQERHRDAQASSRRFDALNAKFKDDPQAKNVAMMELWRKAQGQPARRKMSAGAGADAHLGSRSTRPCRRRWSSTTRRSSGFPTSRRPIRLFFHTVGPLPIILGAAMIGQQRITPPQGTWTPMQQKMMNWLMPGGSSLVMMLFLPAALGDVHADEQLAGQITQQLVTCSACSRTSAPTSSEAEWTSAAATSSSRSDKKLDKKPNKNEGAATAAALADRGKLLVV